MNPAENVCLECGNPLAAARRPKLFCAAPCRQTFNNRRMQRGADMYDLFRALRRERSKSGELNIWTLMCQLEKRWNDEDAAQRPDRKSYIPPKRAIANLFDKGALQRGEILVKGRSWPA